MGYRNSLSPSLSTPLLPPAFGLIPPSFVGGSSYSAVAFAQPASKVALRRRNPQRLSPSLSTQLIAPAFSLPCSHQPLGSIPPSFVVGSSYSAAAFAHPESKVAIRRRNPPRLSPSLSTQLIPPAFSLPYSAAAFAQPESRVAIRRRNAQRLSPSLSTQLIAPAFSLPCSHQPLGLIPPSFVGGASYGASYAAVAFAQPASRVALRRRNPQRLSPSLSTQLIAPAFFPIDSQTRAIKRLDKECDRHPLLAPTMDTATHAHPSALRSAD